MTELAGRLRVVVIVIDAMPHRYVGPELTPNLWRQVVEGGWAPDGGRSLPVSVTYANLAALVTGADPVDTGVHGNHAWDDGRGWVPAPAEGPRATTIFDRVARAGGRSVAIVGDHKLVTQMGTASADDRWPAEPWFTEDTARCTFGFATDEEVVAAAEAIDLDADLVVLHLNEPDTTSHLHGPDSLAAIEQYRATDVAYGRLIDLLAAGWERTVVITVSDHDQEPVTEQEPIDLAGAVEAFDVAVADEGTAALLRGRIDEPVRAAVYAVPGIESAEQLAPDVWMAWSEPGRTFLAAPIPILGQHGSPRCRTQVAIVSGGGPPAADLARRIERRRPSVLDWTPAIAELLGVGVTR